MENRSNEGCVSEASDTEVFSCKPSSKQSEKKGTFGIIRITMQSEKPSSKQKLDNHTNKYKKTPDELADNRLVQSQEKNTDDPVRWVQR